jgi:hypothetical protein
MGVGSVDVRFECTDPRPFVFLSLRGSVFAGPFEGERFRREEASSSSATNGSEGSSEFV